LGINGQVALASVEFLRSVVAAPAADPMVLTDWLSRIAALS